MVEEDKSLLICLQEEGWRNIMNMKGWQEECDIEREKYSQERVVEMSEAVMGSKVISSSRLVATSIVALALLGLHHHYYWRWCVRSFVRYAPLYRV
jgi:hypothetical protein